MQPSSVVPSKRQADDSSAQAAEWPSLPSDAQFQSLGELGGVSADASQFNNPAWWTVPANICDPPNAASSSSTQGPQIDFANPGLIPGFDPLLQPPVQPPSIPELPSTDAQKALSGARSSSGESPEGGQSEAGPKRTRKRKARAGHENHRKLRACDACFVRRRACVRLDPSDPTCETCLRLNTKCSNERPRVAATFATKEVRQHDHPAQPGTSGRPQGGSNKRGAPSAAASAPPAPLYLYANDGGVDTTTGAASSSVSLTAVTAAQAPSLSEFSAEGRLGLAEESESLMTSLMESHLQWAIVSKPIAQYRNLQARFVQAGRRPQQLDVMTRALAFTCMGMAAMFSDHPGVVGHGAPRMAQHRALPRRLPLSPPTPSSVGSVSTDLSPWAGRRKGFCKQMMDQVRQQIDNSGCFRIACAESVVILAMGVEVANHFSGRMSSSWHDCQPYWASALAHLQQMADSNDIDKTNQNELFSLTDLTLCSDDAFRTAYLGTRPLWSDEDVKRFLPPSRFPQYTLEELVEGVEKGDFKRLENTFLAQWVCITGVNRRLAKQVSCKLARASVQSDIAKSIDPGVFIDIYAASEEILARCVRMRDGIRALPSEVKLGRPMLKNRRDSTPDPHLDCTVLGAAASILAISTAFGRWQKMYKEAIRGSTRFSVDGAGGGFNIDEDVVAKVEETSRRLLLACVCLLSGMLMDREEVAGFELRSYLSPFFAVQHTLHRWATVAIDLPHAEAGGPPHYPLSLKIEVTSNIIAGLRAQAFVWTDRTQLADECEAKLFRKTQQALPQAPSMPTIVDDRQLATPRQVSLSALPADQSWGLQPPTTALPSAPLPIAQAASAAPLSPATQNLLDTITGSSSTFLPDLSGLMPPDLGIEPPMLAPPVDYRWLGVDSWNTANVPWDQLLAQLSP